MSVRVTQSTTELSFQSGAGKVRLTQGTAEISFQSGAGKVRFSQGTAEISFQSGIGLVRLSQIAVEVSLAHNVLLQLHVKKPITAWQVLPETRQPFGFLQSAALLGATPVYPPGRHFGILSVHGVREEEHANQPWIGRVPAARRRRPLGWVVS